jgi:aminoglycoside phosphotransferase (APT) family kinase protein
VTEPFASGREADVFALDDTRVLRRYRTGADVAVEAEVMAYAGGLGFPVPKVYQASGTDLVMERIDGPTLATALLSGDLPIAEGSAIMADLLRRLHELPARSGPDTVVHLDLHPENVMLAAHGPMVIDWHNAGDGPADLDTAFTALILAEVALGSLPHPIDAAADSLPIGAAAGELLDRFLDLAPGDPTRLLSDAVRMRSQQTTLSPAEVGMLGAAAARVRGTR